MPFGKQHVDTVGNENGKKTAPCGHGSYGSGWLERRHEWRRGTQKCVRYRCGEGATQVLVEMLMELLLMRNQAQQFGGIYQRRDCERALCVSIG